MAATAGHLPRFIPNKPDIFDAHQKMRLLGRVEPVLHVDRVAEAEERGRRQAEEKAAAEIARMRGEERAAADGRLAEAQQRWTAETADKLTAQLSAGLAGISGAFAEQLGRVLAPFLERTVRERAFDELSETILQLLHSGRHLTLRITGNAELVERMRAKLAGHPHSAEFIEGQPDLHIAVDDTVMETQIGAWVARIEAALRGRADG